MLLCFERAAKDGADEAIASIVASSSLVSGFGHILMLYLVKSLGRDEDTFWAKVKKQKALSKSVVKRY